MIKKYIYFIVICALFPSLMSAQSLNKARKQMDKYNYSQAIKILTNSASKGKTHNASLPLLGECYRMQHDMLNAKLTYEQAVGVPDAKPEVIFYYAQALQSTGKYTQAKEMYQQYSLKNPSDPRAKRYMIHCDSVLGPWKSKIPQFEVKLVNNINSVQSDFGPAFYNGELTYASDFNYNPGKGKKYGWTGRGYLNIMKSDPQVAGDFWGSMGATTSFDSKFNRKYHDGPAVFSTDGNSIYFTRSFYGKANRQGKFKTNLLKIYYASKTDGQWGKVIPFFLNSKDYSVGHPSISADGQSLYFVSDMPGGQGGTDIWMCKRETGTWGPASNLGSPVNTSENEMFPTIQSNDTLYFASDGHPGYGAFDIFKTKNINGTWTTPENLHPPINGSFDDFAIAFAPGEKNGFFSSNRPDGVGSDDIYAFRTVEPPAPVLPSFITGFVKDKTTLLPIAGAMVFLYEPITGNVRVVKTDSAGMYKAEISKPADYIVKAMMANYIADCNSFPQGSMQPGKTSIAPGDLLLDKLTINKTFRVEMIYYDFDKYNIRSDAKVELDKLVTILNENAINVELGSHTDCRGSFAYNERLSQNRAESAVKYIVSAGINKNRITAKGYGERQLTNKCADRVVCTHAEHQANRRTEFKVTSLNKPDINPDQFDPGLYYDGQELNAKLLPPEFFKKCR